MYTTFFLFFFYAYSPKRRKERHAYRWRTGDHNVGSYRNFMIYSVFFGNYYNASDAFF